jgi:hypothetical protein
MNSLSRKVRHPRVRSIIWIHGRGWRIAKGEEFGEAANG